ncbi:NucA/NucB deoxyribonuclease domain-containing protein [Virgibacillus sp. LDC-1]|uniref:NucA/NucB deoxyribonuclease domain-containing protein n=1 Tax=Virgibacillus sp. LDC-1 TaxID=3039856 RepID=UPI0024DE6DFB|nr:NucA/NucB deoxyribonuclease domain-containing protein [Virgibacillus sp. LDC-1]
MEQHTPEPKSPSIFGKLGSWAKIATKKATTGLQQVGAGLVVGAKVAGKIGMKSAKFLVFDDVNTLFNKDASFLDRTIAAVSLVPVPIGKVLKVAKLGKLGFSANSAGKATRGSGAASNVSKGTGKVDVEVTIPSNRYPETSKHIQDAQKAGHPDTLTIDRSGAKLRRKDSLSGLDKVPGKDLDEYPPAMFKEGGMGASVRPVSPSDNRGAGAYLGNKLRNYPDGTRVRLK